MLSYPAHGLQNWLLIKQIAMRTEKLMEYLSRFTYDHSKTFCRVVLEKERSDAGKTWKRTDLMLTDLSMEHTHGQLDVT